MEEPLADMAPLRDLCRQLARVQAQATPPIDTGLRFRQASSNTFQCPACGEVINLHEGIHGEE
jgi:hypothetical protein